MTEHTRFAFPARALVGTVTLIMLAACMPVGATPSSSPGAPTTVVPSMLATTLPIPTVEASPTESSPASAEPSPSATEFEQEPPPIGEIRIDGGTSVAGLQGSWCYDRGCLDAGPLPIEILPELALESAGQQLTFDLAASHPFTYWRADYSTGPDDPELVRLASGGEYYDPYLGSSPGPPTSSFEFAGPPSGDWRLEIHLQFADLGATVYYWHVIVE